MHPNVSVRPRLATVTAPRTHDLDIIPDDAYDDDACMPTPVGTGSGTPPSKGRQVRNLPLYPQLPNIALRLCLRGLGQARVQLTLRCKPSNVNLPYSTLQLAGVQCNKFSVDDRCHLKFLSRELTTKDGSSKLPSGQPSQPKVRVSKIISVPGLIK